MGSLDSITNTTNTTNTANIAKARAYVGNNYPAWGSHQFTTLHSRGLLPHHTLLDVGAGCLSAGKIFIEYLHPGNYWAVEPTDWLIESSGVPLSSYHLYRFSDWKLTQIDHQFDYILAHSIFPHADRSTIQLILSEALGALAPGGTFCASFYDPRCGDSDHTGWHYPGGVSYASESIDREAKKAGFVDVEIALKNSHPADHSWLFGRKQ